MINIETLRQYYGQGKVFMTGEIIEQYQRDFPFPSCLIFGITIDNSVIHVVASEISNIDYTKVA